MNHWRLIPSKSDLSRFHGCNVQLVRQSGTVVRGKLEKASQAYVNIDGLPSIYMNTTDALYWDVNGQQPKKLYDSETKELAKVMHEAKITARGGPVWGSLHSSMQEDLYLMAEQAIKWCDRDVSKDQESDDLDGSELCLAVARKLAKQRQEAWDIAVHDGNDAALMTDAQELIDLINTIQGT
jgi:hypothetical protein